MNILIFHFLWILFPWQLQGWWPVKHMFQPCVKLCLRVNQRLPIACELRWYLASYLFPRFVYPDPPFQTHSLCSLPHFMLQNTRQTLVPSHRACHFPSLSLLPQSTPFVLANSSYKTQFRWSCGYAEKPGVCSWSWERQAKRRHWLGPGEGNSLVWSARARCIPFLELP